MKITQLYIYFFFSSRRRHTRSTRDWSSDVCSSDLRIQFPFQLISVIKLGKGNWIRSLAAKKSYGVLCKCFHDVRKTTPARSEERRVGKECRSRGSQYQERKKKRKTTNATSQ